jgi:hypothetical protein
VAEVRVRVGVERHGEVWVCTLGQNQVRWLGVEYG